MPNMSRPTMREIADAAGVSQATVSMALRGHPRVSQATTEGIRRLAEEMGYRPDPYISTLMSRVYSGRRGDESPVLAALDVDERLKSAPTIQAFLSGAQRRAAALGFDLQVFPVASDSDEQKRLHRQLQARGIRGVLILPVGDQNQVHLPWQNYAVAMLGYPQENFPVHHANCDLYENMLILLTHLKARGYHRIALTLPRQLEERNQHRRKAAFLVAAPVPSPELVYYHDVEKQPFPQWIRQHRPDLVISTNPDYVKGLLSDAFARSGKCPKFMQTHFLSIEAAPDAYGIDCRAMEVGAAGIDLVIAQIHRNETGFPSCPKSLAIAGVLVEEAHPRKTP
jgi:LacI family transcriptional regulator